MDSNISRRDLLKYAGSGALTCLAVPSFTPRIANAEEKDPHFILQVIFPGGMDTHYLFDARPLEMTKNKLIQNYIGEEPNIWTGSNGQSTLATKLTNPLKPYKDYFSIINGVVMDPTFDGHEQNMAFWYTGNPFGGEFFMPHLNKLGLPLDYADIGEGQVFVMMSNTSKGVPLTNKSMKGLTEKIKKLPRLGSESHLFNHVNRRMKAISQIGNGRFSGGAWAMQDALQNISSLSDRISHLKLTETRADEKTKSSIDLMSELFKAGITQSASMVFKTDFGGQVNLDVHSGEDAKAQVTSLPTLIGEVATIFKTLKDTPYDAKRSMLDMTTVLVTTEFGRTMRGGGNFDESGTDHNSLVNTVLVGGKGIKGGQVIGSSDYQSSNAKLSGAHKSFDAEAKCIMGNPFDFDKMISRTDLPSAYDPKDYLTASSIINTVYKMYGVSKEQYRIIERNGPAARTLDGLLI